MSLDSLDTVTLALPTADRQQAHAFYGAGLGLDTPGDLADDGVPEPLRVVVNDGLHLMLVPTGGFGWVIADRPVAEGDVTECQVVVEVPDRGAVTAFAERWTAAGGSVAAGPEDRGWAVTANLADPDGHLWMVMTVSAE